MTNKEREILEIIKADPTIEQSQIAELLHISRSTVAVHISSLQRQGYLLGKGYIINDESYVVGIGASNVDVYGKSRIKIRTHYDHPADIRSSVGGVMHNIITNYVRLSGKARIITAYGDDSYGRSIVEDFQKNQIDYSDSLQVPGVSSGVFMQIQDENNDMYLAICDMSILDRITPEYLRGKEKIIAGAGLDVTDPEPLPADSPMWKTPQIIITPHISGGNHMRYTYETIIGIFMSNLKRYLAGEALRNEVDFETGYRKLTDTTP